MATTDLLTAVLSPQGWYCIVGLKQEGHPRQVFVQTLVEAEDEITKLLSQKYDVYFACAKYENDADGRTQKNSTYFKSFWLDVDCGVDKDLTGKGYLDQETGIAELKIFCDKTGLPLPTIVNSGRGVHAYWILSLVHNGNPSPTALKPCVKSISLELTHHALRRAHLFFVCLRHLTLNKTHRYQ
jgi:hypothetical protein